MVNVSDEYLILYILAANYNQKHLENSKIELENSWIFFLPKEWEPCVSSMFMRLLLSNDFYTVYNTQWLFIYAYLCSKCVVQCSIVFGAQSYKSINVIDCALQYVFEMKFLKYAGQSKHFLKYRY